MGNLNFNLKMNFSNFVNLVDDSENQDTFWSVLPLSANMTQIVDTASEGDEVGGFLDEHGYWDEQGQWQWYDHIDPDDPTNQEIQQFLNDHVPYADCDTHSQN